MTYIVKPKFHHPALPKNALGYTHRADGVWSVTSTTELGAAQVQRLPTVRQEIERWEMTGEAPAHERLSVPWTRAKRPGLAQAISAARRRQKTRLRVQRLRAKNCDAQSGPPVSPTAALQTRSQPADLKGRKTPLSREPRVRP